MLDDLTKEIKAQLYERVKSPLFGAFALSWVGWNYRAILAVLSKMSFPETAAYLDKLYPSNFDWLWHCFGGPLVTATLFLLIYPWPARAMYWYWATQHKKLKKVQQDIEDETPLTQEEATVLRKTSLEQVATLEAKILEQRQLNNELNERLREAAAEHSRIVGERDQFSEAAKKAQEELAQHLAEVLHDAASLNPAKALEAAARVQEASSRALEEKIAASSSPFPNQPVGHPLPKSATELAKAFEQGAKVKSISDADKAFGVLCKLDGAMTNEVATVLGWDVSETHQVLLGLVGDGRAIRSGEAWRLSEKGKLAKTEFPWL